MIYSTPRHCYDRASMYCHWSTPLHSVDHLAVAVCWTTYRRLAVVYSVPNRVLHWAGLNESIALPEAPGRARTADGEHVKSQKAVAGPVLVGSFHLPFDQNVDAETAPSGLKTDLAACAGSLRGPVDE